MSRFTDNSPETQIVAKALSAYSRPRDADWRFYSGQAMRVLNALDDAGLLAQVPA